MDHLSYGSRYESLKLTSDNLMRHLPSIKKTIESRAQTTSSLLEECLPRGERYFANNHLITSGLSKEN